MINPIDPDINLFLSLNGDGGWFVDQIMWYASAKLTWVPLYALLLWWTWKNKGWKFALLFLITTVAAVAASDLTCSFFKANFSKFRPTHYPPLEGMVHTVNNYIGGLYGTVSAHAATTTAMAVIFSRTIRKQWATAGLIAWVTLVCYSRIYLGVHYPVDIIMGVTTGLLWGIFFYKIMKFAAHKWVK